MPINKSQRNRLFVIDRCLRSGREYTSLEIMKEVNAYLESIGQPLVAAKNTIVNDIDNIEHIWKAPLSTRTGHKNAIYYSYSDPHFSIFSSLLIIEDYEKLIEIVDTLNSYGGLPQFAWINELKAKIYTSAHETSEQKPIVSFSHNPAYNVHLRHFTPLFDLIKAKSAIELTYQKFNSEAPSTRIFHPYHLKEFQNRWYLVGWCKEHSDHLSCFGFERIISFERSEAEFVENPGFDVEEYFGAMVGITIPDGAKPEDVEIWVENCEYPYLATNPIHKSQKVVREENGGKVLRMHLFTNFELEMRLFAYGERLIVLAPADLRERMHKRSKAMTNNYE